MNITYLDFEQANHQDLLAIANENDTRTHLIQHPQFDNDSIKAWIKDKKQIDAMPGCRVRVVVINDLVAGWCGVQPDDNGVEIAIVIGQQFWGAGKQIFKTMMLWAAELGHKEVLFHLLETRKQYKSLSKLATQVHKTQLLGRTFTTYHLPVK